jgi:hypothetical protein
LDVQTAGESGLNQAAQGINVVLGHPLKKRDKGSVKERFRVKNLADFFQGLAFRRSLVFQDVAGHLPFSERHFYPASHLGPRFKVSRHQIEIRLLNRQGDGNSHTGFVFARQDSSL